MALLDEVNQSYVQVHYNKEVEFWKSKMKLEDYQEGQFEKAEQKYKAWVSNPQYLPKIRHELQKESLSPQEREGLQGWLRFFTANAIEDPEALIILQDLIEAEARLEAKQLSMTLGYIHPETKDFISSSYGELVLMLKAEKNEELRKAAWEGLQQIGAFILENGFIDIIKKRNQLAHKLGYEDYYDYKVQLNEGFSKRKLFKILDELESITEKACQESVHQAVTEHGKKVLDGWNFDFLTSGDLTEDLDPYFNFTSAFSNWVRSFSAMQVKFSGATVQLDLLDRKGKYHNGFMHGLLPAFVDNGTHKPAKINFTSNAISNKIGSGIAGHKVLFHEGGHAAHFSNIRKPAPCFSQEFTPTSVAFAETQSMFLESIIDDPAWLYAYARDEKGNPMPLTLIQKLTENNLKYLAKSIRSTLAICYVEKGIYEMSDDALTAENIACMAEFWESKMEFTKTVARPVLRVPHIISGEASAYCHGYVLAEMAVFQTREYFIKKYGYIADNPNIGPELTDTYWKCGNAKDFLTLVKELTGEPFSARATGVLINRSIDDTAKQVKEAIENCKHRQTHSDSLDLDGHFKLVDGDYVIANSDSCSFEEMATLFRRYANERFPQNH